MAESWRLPLVKICGLTRLEDARACLSAGAGALGFVCHPHSPRHVEREPREALLRALSGVLPAIAVFVDRTREEIERELAASAIDAVQLCGAQRPEEWEDFGKPILRRLAVEEGARAELERWAGIASLFVLDHPASAGGSGRTVDWALAASLARSAPCLLAGGLDEGNVEQAVRAVRPSGVDVSSRLESSPGVKNIVRTAEFIRRARAALEEPSS